MPENDAPQGGGGNAVYPTPTDVPPEFWTNPEWPNAYWKHKRGESPEEWTGRTHQIPYRGAEQHGVPFVADPAQFRPTPAQDKATVDYVPSYGEQEATPVPVRVVDTSAPIEERRKVALSTTPLLLPVGGVIRIVGERSNRTQLQVWVIPVAGQTVADRIWVSEQDNPAPPYVGVPLDAMSAGAAWKTNTTTDLWATLDTAATKGALVCVAEEYVIHIVGTNLKANNPGTVKG